MLWIQFPLEATFCWFFFKPLDINSGLKCKCDLVVKNSNGKAFLSVRRKATTSIHLSIGHMYHRQSDTMIYRGPHTNPCATGRQKTHVFMVQFRKYLLHEIQSSFLKEQKSKLFLRQLQYLRKRPFLSRLFFIVN